mmetsp:Transcript_44261/g.146683  ORF Transcript_44261/g.146683 Transcript_44261/m.146683 type:complete len:267 (-) Transcript_44261:201-1001(-)
MASLGFHCATPPPHGASTSPPPSMELWLQAPSRSGSDLGAARRGLASLLEAPSPSLRSCGSILCSARCLRSTTCSARRCSSPSSASTLAAPSAAPAPAPSPSASPSPTSTPPSSSARRLRSGRCLPAALRCSARRRSSCSPRLAWPVSARTSTSWRAAASPRRGARGARHRRFAASSPTFSGSSTARFGSQTRPQERARTRRRTPTHDIPPLNWTRSPPQTRLTRGRTAVLAQAIALRSPATDRAHLPALVPIISSAGGRWMTQLL